MAREFPPLSGPAFSFTPLAMRPTSAAIIQNIFPLIPGTPSTPAQIAQALIVSGSGLARIDATIAPADAAVISSVPQTIVPAIPGAILVPVVWSLSKTVSAAGALASLLSLTYPAPWAAGVPIAQIASDTNNARPGRFFGFLATSLSLFSANDPTGLALQLIGSADPGNFPATQIAFKLSVIFYSWTP